MSLFHLFPRGAAGRTNTMITAVYTTVICTAAAASYYTYIEYKRLKSEYTFLNLPDEDKQGENPLYTLCPDKTKLIQRNVTAVIRRVPRVWLKNNNNKPEGKGKGRQGVITSEDGDEDRTNDVMSDNDIWSRAIFSVPTLRFETFIVGGFKTSYLKLPKTFNSNNSTESTTTSSSSSSSSSPSRRQQPVDILNGCFKVIQAPSSTKAMIASWRIGDPIVALYQKLGSWFGNRFKSRIMSGGRHLLEVRPVDPKTSLSPGSSPDSTHNLSSTTDTTCTEEKRTNTTSTSGSGENSIRKTGDSIYNANLQDSSELVETEMVDLVFACAPDFQKINRYTGKLEEGCKLPNFLDTFHLLYTAYLMDRATHQLRYSKGN